MIPFNKPFFSGKEIQYIQDAVSKGKISGNGYYTQKCHEFFQERYGFKKCLLSTSCTDALEMAAILSEIHPGDEVIVPSYTFVSSALAFVRQGARIVFADSQKENPNIDADKIESLITKDKKVIVAVHYAGIACDMDKIMNIAAKYNLLVIEDAAQSIDSYYKGIPLGSIGNLSAFSFHETKNVISGEGGMLCINDERFINRAEIIWEKGTNRASFFRGEVNKYGWVDTGSSFLPSEITAAFLYAQLENIDRIQARRKALWNRYDKALRPAAEGNNFSVPSLPGFATINGHMYYLICKSIDDRTQLIQKLKNENILAVSHYLSLHNSEFYKSKYSGLELIYSDRYTDTLVRLPLYFELTDEEQDIIIDLIRSFYTNI